MKSIHAHEFTNSIKRFLLYNIAPVSSFENSGPRPSWRHLASVEVETLKRVAASLGFKNSSLNDVIKSPLFGFDRRRFNRLKILVAEFGKLNPNSV